MKFIALNMVQTGTARFDEDLGREVVEETSIPTVINTAAIRCFYPRRGERPGTRITFADGGGFAVVEEAAEVARLIDGEALALALAPVGQPVIPPAEAPSASAEPASAGEPAAPRRTRRAN